MRIAVKGGLTPGDLRWAVSLLADRFERVGVDEMPGFHLYVSPRVAGEELVAINEADQPLEGISIRSDFIERLGGEAPSHRLVHPADRGLLHMFAWFSTKLSLSPGVQRELLGGVDHGRWLKLNGPCTPELTKEERIGLTLVADALALLEKACGDSAQAMAWLQGANPMLGFDGETPAEQLSNGGRLVLDALHRALSSYVSNAMVGGPPPRFNGPTGDKGI